MTTKYFADVNGNYLGGFAGETGITPAGGVETPAPPQHGLAKWNGAVWIEPSRTPTPLEQIRALEQKHDDDQRKITRISILELALDKACANPVMAGETRAKVHELYSAMSRGYRELFALEVECARLRKLIV